MGILDWLKGSNDAKKAQQMFEIAKNGIQFLPNSGYDVSVTCAVEVLVFNAVIIINNYRVKYGESGATVCKEFLGLIRQQCYLWLTDIDQAYINAILLDRLIMYSRESDIVFTENNYIASDIYIAFFKKPFTIFKNEVPSLHELPAISVFQLSCLKPLIKQMKKLSSSI